MFAVHDAFDARERLFDFFGGEWSRLFADTAHKMVLVLTTANKLILGRASVEELLANPSQSHESGELTVDRHTVAGHTRRGDLSEQLCRSERCSGTRQCRE